MPSAQSTTQVRRAQTLQGEWLPPPAVTTWWRSRLARSPACLQGTRGDWLAPCPSDFVQSGRFLRCRLNFSFINHTLGSSRSPCQRRTGQRAPPQDEYLENLLPQMRGDGREVAQGKRPGVGAPGAAGTPPHTSLQLRTLPGPGGTLREQRSLEAERPGGNPSMPLVFSLPPRQAELAAAEA